MLPSLLGWEIVMTFKTQESRFKRRPLKTVALDVLRLRISKRKCLKVIRLQKIEVAERL